MLGSEERAFHDKDLRGVQVRMRHADATQLHTTSQYHSLPLPTHGSCQPCHSLVVHRVEILAISNSKSLS
jgi:hypothetical protein